MSFIPGIDLPHDADEEIARPEQDRPHSVWPHQREAFFPENGNSKIHRRLNNLIHGFRVHPRREGSEDRVNLHWTQYVRELAKADRRVALAACYYTVIAVIQQTSLHRRAVEEWVNQIVLLAAENFPLAAEIARNTHIVSIPDSLFEREVEVALKRFEKSGQCAACKREWKAPGVRVGGVRLG